MRSDDDESVGPFRVGEVILDNFEILGVLGVGGMGVVYEALDRALLRRVAIKTARFPEHVGALRREAQGLVAINHPGFVTVHASLEYHGIQLVVMERLYGDTLDVRLDELRVAGKHFHVSEVLDLLITISESLSAAHRAGVAQRDLKPSNIMLCDHRVVLLDLGLFVPEVMIGPENVAAGSIEYISPEVILGHVKPGEGPLIDLYALGALAYELLTNRTPFLAETMNKTLMGHIGATIPNVLTERPDTPRELAALISELLAKDPALRPPSAEAVLWQLTALREHGRRMPHLNILAIDDDVHVGRALKSSLESAFPKLHVDAITDPEKALRRQGYELAAHDVVLVDLNMPKHNGIEVCMNLLALDPEKRPVVVAMSAEAQKSDLEVLRGLGVRHFVPKDAAFVAVMSQVIGDVREKRSRKT